MEKKELNQAEVEVIVFDKQDDIVTASTVIIGPIGGEGAVEGGSF